MSLLLRRVAGSHHAELRTQSLSLLSRHVGAVLQDEHVSDLSQDLARFPPNQHLLQ
ncbi:Metal transporter Nramp5, partial [Clarias magur]